MKKNIILAAFALLGCTFASAQTETTEPVSLPPTADTYLRSNKEVNNGAASTVEIWTQYDGNEPAAIVADFAGLMSFDIPEKPGYEVSKATLVLYANVVNGDQNFTIYPFTATFTEKDMYTDHVDDVAAARTEEPIVKDVELNGWHGHGVKDVLTKPGADEKYKDIENWRTDIDLTDYIRTVEPGTVSFLFDHNTGTKNTYKIEIFSKDADDNDTKLKDIIKTGYKINAKQVKPHLDITYTLSTGIDNISAGNNANAGVKKGIYTLSGVRVAKATQPGIYIIDGKKVIVGKK